VTYYKGTGSFKSQNEIIIKDDQNKETIIEAEKTVIATGSVPVSLPGIEIDEGSYCIFNRRFKIR
jgi:dihydrolipoamide dehydrogenase